jgi:Ca-activated chloride channel family protein
LNASAGAGGQQPSTPAGARSAFRSAVDLVTLHVTVTDQRRQYVTDLNREQFEVFENGRRQQLKFFQAKGLPLALTLLLDTSASMTSALPEVQEVAHQFVDQLDPADIASVFTFDESVRVLQDFTADRHALKAAVGRAHGGSGTSLFTALYIALNEFEKARRWDGAARRRTLVLLSDGEDSSSLIGFSDLMELASTADAAIYAIRLGRATRPIHPAVDETERVLRRLAELTGGRAFFPATRYEFRRIHDAIRTELASQYSLAYESDDRRQDGRFRTLAVLIGGRNAVARTKRGYVARANQHRPE